MLIEADMAQDAASFRNDAARSATDVPRWRSIPTLRMIWQGLPT
jgi:hypothetical protein